MTVNDYLARRDAEWMSPLFRGLGMTVGAIQSDMDSAERQEMYACDITYGTNNEFGFDYLRDNMKPSKELQAQGELYYAIIDEVDSILIDEARTPLIISGPAFDDVRKYAEADRIARLLRRDTHFEVKEKERTCHLTDEGVRDAERIAGLESFYTPGNMEWPHLIDNALKAHHLYKRDRDYVVQPDGEVVIVDEFTGRLMIGRQWSDGSAPGGRGQGTSQDQGGKPDPRHDHLAEFLQALQEALRHDRDGDDRGDRILQGLWPGRVRDSDQPAAGRESIIRT